MLTFETPSDIADKEEDYVVIRNTNNHVTCSSLVQQRLINLAPTSYFASDLMRTLRNNTASPCPANPK